MPQAPNINYKKKIAYSGYRFNVFNGFPKVVYETCYQEVETVQGDTCHQPGTASQVRDSSR